VLETTIGTVENLVAVELRPASHLRPKVGRDLRSSL